MAQISVSVDWSNLEWFLGDKFMESLRETMGYPKGCNYIDALMVDIVMAGVHANLVRSLNRGERKGL